MSPTARSLKELRRRGYIAEVVESWNSHTKRRKDFIGCVDIIGFREFGVLGVQACMGASHAARRAKAIAEPRLCRWLEAGNLFFIWSWRLAGPRGARKLWELREEQLTRSDIDYPDPAADAAGGTEVETTK